MTATAVSRTGLLYAAMSLAVCAVSFNSTSIIAALPSIKADLALTEVTTQWIMNIYLLATAVSLVSAGRLADIFGKMRVLIFGLCVFALGSLGIIVVFEAGLILAFRGLQGLGAACLLTTTIAILNVAVDKARRPVATGLWAGMVALGYGTGPLIGGLVTDVFGWRGIFVVDLAIVVSSFVLCLRLQHAGIAGADDRAERPIDFLGIALLIVTLGAFFSALIDGHAAGWQSVEILSLFGIAIVGGIAFLFWERRTGEPLVYLPFFRRLRYVAAAFGMFIAGYTQLAFLFYYNLFVQSPDALGFSAYEAGLSLLPFSVSMFLCSIFLPRLLASYSARAPVTLGLVVLCTGFLSMAFTAGQVGYAALWPSVLAIGVGTGLVFALLPRAGLSALPDESAGQGSGIINTSLYIGCTLGVAVSGIAASQVKYATVAPAVAQLNLDADRRAALVSDLAYGSADTVHRALEAIGAAQRHTFDSALAHATIDAFERINLIAAVFALVGAIAVATMLRENRS